MARSSPGFGIGVAILAVILGIIASVPQEIWIGLIVLCVVGLALYLYPKNHSTTENSTRVPAEQGSVPTVSRSSVRDIDLLVSLASCWVPMGKEVTVQGLHIPGGMLYIGKNLTSVSGYGIEPALINPVLPVRMPTEPVDRMDYWPSYSSISATERGGYLQWLAGGRKDQNVQIGFVFLFFYGLERRALHDSRQHKEEVNRELPGILSEVRRLLSIYGGSGAFYGYANHFLDLILTVGAHDRLYTMPAPPLGRYKSLTLRHKVALGQAAVDGVPLPTEWAYSWLNNDERVFLRTPAQRCPEEFRKLFFAGYAKEFGDGLKLSVNKTKLKALYKPASASFGYSHVELTGGDLPDITVLEGPLNKLREIAEHATAQIESYSRFLGRNPEKKDLMDALVFLPPQLWPNESKLSLTSWLAQLGADKSMQPTTFGQMACHFTPFQELTKDRAAAFASALEELGVGMEPDVRWGGATPSEDSSIVIFPIASEERGAKPSTLYGAATLTMHLAAAVAAADGGVSPTEEEHLEKQLERWLHLGAPERTRLRAHLNWLLLSPPALTALKKRVSALDDEKKHSIAGFLVDVAQAEGGVSVSEVKALAKVYRLFGFDEKSLYSQLHSAATEPVTIKPPQPCTPGFGIPRKPVVKPTGGFVLDHDRIAALKGDTERVSALLGTIFIDEERPPEAVPPAEPEASPESLSIAGLDTGYSELVRLLVSRDAWMRVELEDLATDRGIMLDGALEHINEAFLDVYSEPLMEGDDPIEVNRNVAKELEAE